MPEGATLDNKTRLGFNLGFFTERVVLFPVFEPKIQGNPGGLELHIDSLIRKVWDKMAY